MDTGPVPIKWQHWAGLFSELFCYRKTPVKTQSLTQQLVSKLSLDHQTFLNTRKILATSNL